MTHGLDLNIMRYFQKMSIEEFIRKMIIEDAPTTKIADAWNIDHVEAIQILSDYFKELGIFYVKPMENFKIVYKHLHLQMLHSHKLHERIRKTQESIAHSKAKNNRQNKYKP